MIIFSRLHEFPMTKRDESILYINQGIKINYKSIGHEINITKKKFRNDIGWKNEERCWRSYWIYPLGPERRNAVNSMYSIEALYLIIPPASFSFFQPISFLKFFLVIHCFDGWAKQVLARWRPPHLLIGKYNEIH